MIWCRRFELTRSRSVPRHAESPRNRCSKSCAGGSAASGPAASTRLRPAATPPRGRPQPSRSRAPSCVMAGSVPGRPRQECGPRYRPGHGRVLRSARGRQCRRPWHLSLATAHSGGREGAGTIRSTQQQAGHVSLALQKISCNRRGTPASYGGLLPWDRRPRDRGRPRVHQEQAKA